MKRFWITLPQIDMLYSGPESREKQRLVTLIMGNQELNIRVKSHKREV